MRLGGDVTMEREAMSSERSSNTTPSTLDKQSVEADSSSPKRKTRVYDRPVISPKQWQTIIITAIAIIISIVITMVML